MMDLFFIGCLIVLGLIITRNMIALYEQKTKKRIKWSGK